MMTVGELGQIAPALDGRTTSRRSGRTLGVTKLTVSQPELIKAVQRSLRRSLSEKLCAPTCRFHFLTAAAPFLAHALRTS